MPLTDIQLAKAAMRAVNLIAPLKYANTPVVLHKEQMAALLTAEDHTLDPEYLNSCAETCLTKLCELGRLARHEVRGSFMGWVATSKTTYSSVGAGSDPWVGWVVVS